MNRWLKPEIHLYAGIEYGAQALPFQLHNRFHLACGDIWALTVITEQPVKEKVIGFHLRHLLVYICGIDPAADDVGQVRCKLPDG